jgi:hypothetical protein
MSFCLEDSGFHTATNACTWLSDILTILDSKKALEAKKALKVKITIIMKKSCSCTQTHC